MSEPCSKLPEFARARHMNDVRLKFFNCLSHPGQMAAKQQVIPQVAFDAEAYRTARQLQAGNAALLKLGKFRAGLNRQKRTRMASRKRHEFPGGQRDSIDFVKRLAKKRDSRRLVHKPPSSFPRNAARNAGRASGQIG